MDSAEQPNRPRTIRTNLSRLQDEEPQHSPKPSVTQLSHRRPSNDDQAVVEKDEPEWLTGSKLYIVSTCLITAMFLMMLDASIIATAASTAVVETRHTDTD
jgi:hypothetical protein